MDNNLIDPFMDDTSYLKKLPQEIKEHVQKYAISGTQLIPLLVRYRDIPIPATIENLQKSFRSEKAVIFNKPSITHKYHESLKTLVIKDKEQNVSVVIPWNINSKIVRIELNEPRNLVKIDTLDGNYIYNVTKKKIIHQSRSSIQWNEDNTKLVMVKNNRSPVLFDLETDIPIKQLSIDNPRARYRPAVFKGNRISAVVTYPKSTDFEDIAKINIFKHVSWDINPILDFEKKISLLPTSQLMQLILIHACLKKNPTVMTDEKLDTMLKPVKQLWQEFVESTSQQNKNSLLETFQKIRDSYLRPVKEIE